jgi:hypothetical protein
MLTRELVHYDRDPLAGTILNHQPSVNPVVGKLHADALYLGKRYHRLLELVEYVNRLVTVIHHAKARPRVREQP